MARIREFDPQEALDKAMHLFWRRGYAGTSMRDLVKHTGVAHAGIYSAFGDKRQLYMAALDHYSRTQGDLLMGRLEQPKSSRAEIDGFFAALVERTKKGDFTDGCLMCNTAVDFAHADDAVLEKSQNNMNRMTSAFKDALKRARKRGEVRADLQLLATATFLTSVFHGVAVLARARATGKQVEAIVRTAIAVLD